jgi:hypothetical protein
MSTSDTLIAPELHEDPVARLKELGRLHADATRLLKESGKRGAPAKRHKKEALAKAQESIPAVPFEILKTGLWVGVRGEPGLFKVKRVNLKTREVSVYGGVEGQESYRDFRADRLIPAETAEKKAPKSRKKKTSDPDDEALD